MGKMGMRSATRSVLTTITSAVFYVINTMLKAYLFVLKRAIRGVSEGLLSRGVLTQLKTLSATVIHSAKTLYTTRKHQQI